MSAWSKRNAAKHRHREKMRRWGKASVKVRAALRLLREPDADTVRFRALEDRRGAIAMGFWLPLPDGLKQRFELRHAVRGRTDQYELWSEGQRLVIGGWRKMQEWIKRQCL